MGVRSSASIKLVKNGGAASAPTVSDAGKTLKKSWDAKVIENFLESFDLKQIEELSSAWEVRLTKNKLGTIKALKKSIALYMESNAHSNTPAYGGPSTHRESIIVSRDGKKKYEFRVFTKRGTNNPPHLWMLYYMTSNKSYYDGWRRGATMELENSEIQTSQNDYDVFAGEYMGSGKKLRPEDLMMLQAMLETLVREF